MIKFYIKYANIEDLVRQISFYLPHINLDHATRFKQDDGIFSFEYSEDISARAIQDIMSNYNESEFRMVMLADDIICGLDNVLNYLGL